MPQSLAEALHARLDDMGAPPREQAQRRRDEPERTLAEPETADLPETVDYAETDEVPGETLEGASEDLETDADEDLDEDHEGDAKPAETPDKYRLKDFAEAIGWNVEDLYSDLEIPLARGETVTLGQLKDEVQTLDARKAEVDQARQQIEQAAQQMQQYQQQMLSGAQQQSQEVQDAQRTMAGLEYQYGTIDWDKLEAENPGVAANQRQKFATAYGAAEAKLKAAQQTEAKARQEMAQRMMYEADQKLVQMVPEWQSVEKFREEMPQVQQYLVSKGFRPEELQTIIHPAARAVARDAWLWQQHQAKVGKVSEKVRKAPRRVLRTERAPEVSKTAQRKADELSRRALNTGRSVDKLAAARAIVQSSSSSGKPRRR